MVMYGTKFPPFAHSRSRFRVQSVDHVSHQFGLHQFEHGNLFGCRHGLVAQRRVAHGTVAFGNLVAEHRIDNVLAHDSFASRPASSSAILALSFASSSTAESN